MPAVLQYGCFILTTDLAVQDVPFIIETKRMLMSGHPWWSWNHYIGDNFIASYSYYTVTSPFVWINCLFPEEWMLYGITFTLILKMICAGLTSYAYLRRIAISPESSITGALMYSFSSYAISNLFYYQFMEPMIAFPLLLSAIERFLNRVRFGGVCMILASFFVFFINYYFAACSMIAALIYAICRMCSREIHVKPVRIIYGLALVGIGLLLSAFILLPTTVHLMGNPRQALDPNGLSIHIRSCIERLYTLFEPRLTEGSNLVLIFNSFGSNAANVPVVGLLLAGLYAIRRKGWLCALMAVSLCLYLTPLNGLFSLFTDIGYTRWAYALTLFVILASMKFVDEKQPLTMRHYWIYTTICLIALAISFAYSMYEHYKLYGLAFYTSTIKINFIIQGVFLLQMGLLLAYVKHNTSSMLLKCVVLMSLVYFPLRVLMNTEVMSKSFYRTPWHAYGTVKPYLTENRLPYHKGDFEWRTDIMALFPNISLVKNRPGLSTYSSIQNSGMSLLLEAIGSHLGNNFWFDSVMMKNVVSYDALMSVKEIIEYDCFKQWCDTVYLSVPSRDACLGNKHPGDGYTRYDNKYYIPMGFTYDHYIPQSEIEALMEVDQQADIPLQLLANLVVPDSLIHLANTVMERGSLSKGQPIDSIVTERRKNVCTSFSGNTQGFSATVFMPKKNLLFFSVLSDKGFTAYVDGTPTTIYPANMGLSAIMVEQGDHKIEFKYFPPGLHEGLILTIIGLTLTLLVLFIESKQRDKPSNRLLIE
ncbi:MAG: YfhO family protein [Prevotella sp.]|nr:YfhO family protein [Prevotella sp.]